MFQDVDSDDEQNNIHVDISQDEIAPLKNNDKSFENDGQLLDIEENEVEMKLKHKLGMYEHNVIKEESDEEGEEDFCSLYTEQPAKDYKSLLKQFQRL